MCTRAWLCVRVHGCVCACMGARAWLCVRMHGCVCVCVRVRVCVCVCACACACVFILMLIHVHCIHQIEESPYHYDSHVLLIGLLRQQGDLDGARRARNRMSEVFPLSEGGRGGEGRGGEGAKGVERGGNLY